MEFSLKRKHLIFSNTDLILGAKFMVVVVGVLIPIFFGYWRYETTSEVSKLRDAIGCAVMSMPFNLGLWLSVTAIGRKIRYISLAIVICGSLVHLTFQIYPLFFLPIIIATELFAIYFLFRKVVI